MGVLKSILFAYFVGSLCLAIEAQGNFNRRPDFINNNNNKIVCYYDSRSYFRQGQGKFDIPFLEPALQFCTHLIYGYAALNEQNSKLMPLNEQFDVTAQENYKRISALKHGHPGLKVILSVGGNVDVQGDGKDKNLKYRELLESTEKRLAFAESAVSFVKNYNFDGLDLAWEFPETKPKKIQSKIGKWWTNIKHKIVGESVVDEKAEEHKEQFTALVREIKNKFKHEGLLLTLSVLPNVNSSVYFDPKTLSQNVDFVTLKAFDFYTPQRNPKEADYPAPLYELLDRKFDENADYQVRYWIQQGMPANKIILGIPTFGRAWKMVEDSGYTGVPPLPVDGEASSGPYTNIAGILSYPEVCTKLENPQKLSYGAGKHLRKVADPTKRYGTYAFRQVSETIPEGAWVGYEDPDTAGNKAGYARAKGLGGVALDDLTLDDFRGLCTGDKYPLLRAAKYRL